MIVSGEQRWDSAIHIHVSILPEIPVPSRLPCNTEQISMCCRIFYMVKLVLKEIYPQVCLFPLLPLYCHTEVTLFWISSGGLFHFTPSLYCIILANIKDIYEVIFCCSFMTAICLSLLLSFLWIICGGVVGGAHLTCECGTVLVSGKSRLCPNST